MINLSVTEASRLIRLPREFAAGLITRALLAFALRWYRPAADANNQAIARWHHHNTPATGRHDLTSSDRKEVTIFSHNAGQYRLGALAETSLREIDTVIFRESVDVS